MPLFDFTLRNTAPTLVANPDPYWFWLTDGNYNICINDKRLLSYNPKILTANERAQWKQQAAAGGLHAYEPEYYVVRLYEDVLAEALPYTWNNVSEMQHQCLLNPTVYRMVSEECDDKLLFHEDKSLYDKCHPYCGQFGSGYMVLPEFRLWRYADEIYIYWNGNGKNPHGISWFQQTGEAVFVMDPGTFIREVEDFHHRLMNAMAERIDQVQDYCIRHPDIPAAAIFDYAFVVADHERRRQSFDKALRCKKSANPDFERDNLNAGIHLRQLLAEYPHVVEIVRAVDF